MKIIIFNNLQIRTTTRDQKKPSRLMTKKRQNASMEKPDWNRLMKKMKATIPSLLLLVCQKHSNYPRTHNFRLGIRFWWRRTSRSSSGPKASFASSSSRFVGRRRPSRLWSSRFRLRSDDAKEKRGKSHEANEKQEKRRPVYLGCRWLHQLDDESYERSCWCR